MTNRGRGARMVRAVLDKQQRKLQRRPDPIEVVSAAYDLAGKIAGAERCVGDYSTRLRRPSLEVISSTGEVAVYANDLAAAYEVLELLEQLGADPAERHNDRDREMLRRAALMQHLDFRALARRFQMTAADAEHRVKARCSRI
jgi:hypothetical protein